MCLVCRIVEYDSKILTVHEICSGVGKLTVMEHSSSWPSADTVRTTDTADGSLSCVARQSSAAAARFVHGTGRARSLECLTARVAVKLLRLIDAACHIQSGTEIRKPEKLMYKPNSTLGRGGILFTT